MSFRAKIILLFTILVLVSAGLILFIYLQNRNAGGLEITMTTPPTVSVGVPFIVTVQIDNYSKSALKDTVLSVSLPATFEFMSEVAGKRTITRTIGSLGAGSFTKQDVRIMATSGASSVQQITATASYVPTTLGSRFEKKAIKDVSIGEAAMFLDLAAPQKVFSGEKFTMNITYRNAANTAFSNLQLRMKYPKGFVVTSSTAPTSEQDSTIFDIGDVGENAEGKVSITGILTGPDNAFFDFSSAITTVVGTRTYTIVQRSASVSISPSPLELRTTVNDKTEYISTAGDTLEYTLTYKNNTDVGLKDAIITAKLSGAMLDFSTIDPRQGVYRSTDNTVTWNPARIPALAVIRPGESGSVSFHLRTKKEYPISRLGDRNFVVKISSQIESPTVPYRVASSRTIGMSSLETKVAGSLSLAMTGYYHEPTAKIKNTGTVPPRVGKATTYTIHWTLKNTSTDMAAVKMHAFLGPNVRYTGMFESSTSVAPEYNERTQEISWSVDRIAATQGIISPPTSLVFQVELLPSSDQVNESPTLVERTTLSSRDLWTDADFSTTVDPITTLETLDSSLSSSDAFVIE